MGATALLIAAARARESAKGETERLFYDPHAHALAGEWGHRFLEDLGGVYGNVEVCRPLGPGASTRSVHPKVFGTVAAGTLDEWCRVCARPPGVLTWRP